MLKSKKILILSNNSGGLFGFRRELMQKLIDNGCELYVSTPFDDNIKDLQAMKLNLIQMDIDRRGINPLKDCGLLLKYIRLTKGYKPDLIISYTIKPNLYGGMAAKFLNVPYAINITGLGTAFQKDNLLKKIVVLWYRYVCKNVKVVFFENKGNCQVFLDNKIVSIDKCCVLNGAGVNLAKYPFTKYPSEREQIRFLFIGRIMKEKGIEELFETAIRIKKHYSNVIFDVVGPMEDDYSETIQKLVASEIINYYGYQSNVQEYIKNCHCFILPSYHEGMANTLLECASMGRPLITSDINGCKEAVVENISGYLCEKQNVESLYKRIEEFLQLSYEERKAMGLEGRKHMEAVFDKKKVVEATIKGLEKV